jgi:hypothetical protein
MTSPLSFARCKSFEPNPIRMDFHSVVMVYDLAVYEICEPPSTQTCSPVT